LSEQTKTIPVIAICGVPNSGKTSIFNMLLDQHERTGNYPGVTVEAKSKDLLLNNTLVKVVALPSLA
jgi:ferrous iron transport protein B